MDCKECQNQIEAFLNNQMKDADILRFLKHIDTCKNCRDELEVQYLVRMAVRTEESGEIPNDPRETMNQLLKIRRKNVRLNMQVSVLSVILFVLLIPDVLLLIRFLF